MRDTQAGPDPYQLRPGDVSDPPRGLGQALALIGPGLVLAASIVGSGELIATTTLGAQVGYAALWLILVSCVVKPVIQAEMGRYTIATGETALEAMNHVPGPRFRVGWVVWAWALTVLLTLSQVGGMFGGVSQVMHLLVPAVSVRGWVIVCLAVTLALLLRSGYERVERFAMLKVGLFTCLTVMAAVVLIRMPQHFAWSDLAEGLTFRLPTEGISTAVAVFGITGVGAVELFMYPYWCIEKGYARACGPPDGTAAWAERARGWIRVMHLDIACSMVVYTMATVAFYLLGAGILHSQQTVPAARDMIPVLSRIYTGTLGPWALVPFYVGAVVTLYGTIFASIAAHARIFADMSRLMGRFARDDYAGRVRYRRGFIVALSVTAALAFLLVESPVRMVVFGGVAQALMLPVVGAGTLYLRHRRLPAEIAPNAFVTASLWACTLASLAVAVYYLAS
jgi:Mn2+/Fe2+ NRAMP family transporter